MIALLVPTRRRHKQLRRLLDSIPESVNVYIGYTSGDEAIDYHSHITVFPDGMPTVHKWNILAEQAMKDDRNKLFMLGADDMYFDTPGWDAALLEHYNNLEDKIHVYSLRDSRDLGGTPHPIVTREFILQMGYFLPPVFLHWFGDGWTVDIAKGNNCFTHLKNYLLVHDKPSDIGKPDETHLNIRNMGWHERDKWVNDKLRMNYFGMESQRLRWGKQ